MASSSLVEACVSIATKDLHQRCRHYFIFIYYPAFEFVVPAKVALTFLYDLVDREVFQTGVLRKKLAMAGLSDTWSAGDDDVWTPSSHGSD